MNAAKFQASQDAASKGKRYPSRIEGGRENGEDVFRSVDGPFKGAVGTKK